MEGQDASDPILGHCHLNNLNRVFLVVEIQCVMIFLCYFILKQ